MIIANLHAGGHFGEMGLVDQAPRSATVVAVEETNAISVDRESLLRLMRKDPLIAVKLLWSFVQVLSERLRNTSDALADLKRELDEARGGTDDGNAPASGTGARGRVPASPSACAGSGRSSSRLSAPVRTRGCAGPTSTRS